MVDARIFANGLGVKGLQNVAAKAGNDGKVENLDFGFYSGIY